MLSDYIEHKPGIETERLILKNIGYDDVDFIIKEFSNDEVNRYLFDAEPITGENEARELIDLYLEEEPRNQHRWILVLKETGEKIGTCGFHCWNRETGEVEIGYDIQPEYWRNGYCSEALEAILKFSEREMKTEKVYAHISVKNTASLRTAEKMNFMKTGRKYYEVFRGKKHLHYIYLLRQ